MADSLIVAGQIELLGDDNGIPSTIPACAGATFLLAPGYDMGAPQPVVELLAASLLDGERPIGRRSSNRTITLPVKITAPDRDTLANAREVLLELIDQDEWTLVWTRDGGPPMVLDCFRAAPAAPANDLLVERELVSQLEISFPAAPYGRSDTTEVIQFPSPSQAFDPPPTPVTVDIFTTATNFLTGDQSTFDATAGTWLSAGNCSVSRVTTPTHSGAGALQMSSSAAGTMTASNINSANILTQGLVVVPGDTVNVTAWIRTASVVHLAQVGVEFFDITGVSLGDGLFGTASNDSTTYATRTCAVTAPATAALARVKVRIQSTTAGAELHYVDDVSFDRGPAYSSVDPDQWTTSTLTPVSGHKSAKWSRVQQDYPVYDHVLPAAIDITGRTKFTFFVGLSTSASQYATWHKGSVRFSITLYDATGQSLTFGGRHQCKASGILSQPHWQLISQHITQTSGGFDYTTVSRYVIGFWNHWDSTIKTPGLTSIGQGVLQATAYLAEVIATGTATGPATITRGAFFTFPGIVGTARAPVAFTVAPGLASFSTVTEFTTPGSNAFTVPGGVTQIDKAEAWGGGGGGGSGRGDTSHGGGGGGGGEYAAEFNVPVTALGSYPATVGGGGAGGAAASSGNTGNPGGDSFWTGNGGAGPYAHGGRGGWVANQWGGGKGGSGSTSTRSFAGGNGRQSNVNTADLTNNGGRGGGGGGSGGTGSAGRDGGQSDSWEGATAVTGGGGGGRGGTVSTTPRTGSSPNSGPGGGGGGGAELDGTGPFNGGNGFAGKVRLTYGASGLLAIASLLLHAPGRDEPPAYSPVTNLNDGNDIPNAGTEYNVPAVGTLNARFDGSYTALLVVKTWNTPSNSRTVTVVIKQYPYVSGTAATVTLARTLTPNTDLTGTLNYVDLGAVTLPINALATGNTSAFFTVTQQSSNTSDRFYDVILLSSVGNTLLVNVSGASIFNNMWVDTPDANRPLGLVLGSNADRDQAFSIATSIDKYSGGPMSVEPGIHNRLLVYSQQGCPGTTASYLPRFMLDRIS